MNSFRLPSCLLAFFLLAGAALRGADVRIKDVATTATVPATDDYLLLDGTTNGTRKFLAPRFLGNTTVTFSGVANITTTGNITGNVITGNNLTVVDATTTNLTVSGAVVGVFLGANGGTGVANTGKTITLAGNVTTAGAYNITLTATGATGVTLPTSGTLATLAGTETLTNKTIAAGSNTLSGLPETWVIPIGDETTAITTGTAKVTFRAPYAATVTAVRASLTTVSSSGTPTFDINDGGTTILSTKLTIDASEKTSTTAATAAVISDSALADDAEITIDVDTAGTGAAGAKIVIYVTRA